MNAGNQGGLGPPGELSGLLHVNVAFDLGESIHLAGTKELLSADYFQLPRESRTPSSFRYQTPPLRCRLGKQTLKLPVLGDVSADCDATLFDFGAASVAFHIPFEESENRLLDVAASLSDSGVVLPPAEAVLRPVFEKCRPAIEHPAWSALTEEYFVFQFHPESVPHGIDHLISQQGDWLLKLIRLDTSTPSASEIESCLRASLRYSSDDFFVADWAAAVLIDREADEILETIAFANTQLLEVRQMDCRLDWRLEEAYQLVRRHQRTWLPFWRSHAKTMRELGEFRVEIHQSLEKTTNSLKLIGDQYLARVY